MRSSKQNHEESQLKTELQYAYRLRLTDAHLSLLLLIISRKDQLFLKSLEEWPAHNVTRMISITKSLQLIKYTACPAPFIIRPSITLVSSYPALLIIWHHHLLER